MEARWIGVGDLLESEQPAEKCQPQSLAWVHGFV